MDKIGDYMNSPVWSISSEVTVQEAARIMTSKDIGAILVKGLEDFVGVVTERELARRIVGEGLDLSTPVSVIMTDPIFSIDRDERMMQASKLMQEYNIRHLAVTESGKVVGVLTARDLYSYYSRIVAP